MMVRAKPQWCLLSLPKNQQQVLSRFGSPDKALSICNLNNLNIGSHDSWTMGYKPAFFIGLAIHYY